MIPTPDNDRFPFTAYPVGWHQVGRSHELAPGELKRVQAFGEELVLWRGADGVARLIDAHCPHMGAHIGCGGHVEGNDVACPFHAWQFDGAGKCTKVPYAKRVPPKAQIRSWELREVNHTLFTYHPERGHPGWEIPELEELGSDEWTPIKEMRFRIRSHCQEMAENCVDGPHFLYVHGAFEGMTERCETEDHVFRSFNEVKVKLERWGMPEGELDGKIEVTLRGLGFSLVRLNLLAEILTMATVTPIDGEYLDARFAFTVRKLDDPDMTQFVVDKVVDDLGAQVREDAVIWENKVYCERALLCDGDGPIGAYRRWASQFLPGYEGPGKRVDDAGSASPDVRAA